jgi:CheY-like chemotaxis protein
VNVFDELKKNQNLGLSILVADDDALNQRLMQMILEREGYLVTIAVNGAEAVEMARTHQFDVILMDLQMPVLDGVNASRQIRAWENEGKHTFIVALTASYLPEKGQELFEAGIDNYISKPFDLEHLRHIIRYSNHAGKASAKAASGDSLSIPEFSAEVGLQKLGGSKEIFKELLGEFVQELPEKLERLDTCHQNNEFELLSRLAHNLKGVSANLGAIRLSEQAGRLEKEVDSGALGEIKHIIETIKMAADEFQKSASQYLVEF